MSLRTKLTAALAPLLPDGKSADVFIQTVGGHCEAVVTGQVGGKRFPDLLVHEGFAAAANALNIARISWRAREQDRPEVMIERYPLRASFGVLDVALPPLAFLQPTQAGEDALVAGVMELIPERGRFADLFSGCGTFAGSLLKRGAVDAFENVGDATQALDRAKGAHALRVLKRDLFRNPLTAAEATGYDAIVFDPPRAGAEQQVRALAESNVRRIIGVSCNPVTFARDARILIQGGYALESVKVVDQFTWSHHVELVAAFRKVV